MSEELTLYSYNAAPMEVQQHGGIMKFPFSDARPPFSDGVWTLV